MKSLLCGLAFLLSSSVVQADQSVVYLRCHITIPVGEIPTNVDPTDEPTWYDIHAAGFPAEVQYWNHDVIGQPQGPAEGSFYWEFDWADPQTAGNSSTITGYKYYYKSSKLMTFNQNSGFEWEPITLLPMGYIWDGENSGNQWWDTSQKYLMDHGPIYHTVLFNSMTAPSGYEFVAEN